MSRTSRVLLITLVAAAAGAIAAPFVNRMVFTRVYATNELMGTIWLVVPSAIVALMCSMTRDRGKLRRLMACGIASAWLAWLVWTFMILSQMAEDRIVSWTRWGTAFSAAAVSIAFVGLLSQLRVEGRAGAAVRSVTYVLVFLLAAAGAWAISLTVDVEMSGRWSERDPIEAWGRACGVLAILTGCGLIATIIFATLPRMRLEEIPPSQRLRFTMVCPRCGLRKDVQTEGDACSSCGLKIKVVPT